MDVEEVVVEVGDTAGGEEQAIKPVAAEGRSGSVAGRGMEPGGLAAPRMGNGNGALPAPAAERAAEAAAACR